MSATATDHRFMAHALRLARNGLWTAHPNPRVGCVIVAAGRVVGQGWHERTGGPHAEAVALAEAGALAAGATAYVTLEPCCHQGRTPPCTDALREAGVRRVVFAARDPDPRVAGGGARALEEAGIGVLGGIMAAESRELNRGFVSRMERGRPWVRIKIAASLDGRTALASGKSRWISSEASRRDAHALRARSSAILTGIGTVVADDPALTVRLPLPVAFTQPARVVLDSRLRMPPQSRMLQEPGRTRIVAAESDPARRASLEAAGATVDVFATADGRVDLRAMLDFLATQSINELLVEAGPRLNGALLDAGLVDEVVCYLAPQVIGADGFGMFASRALGAMEGAAVFSIADVRRLGADLRINYVRKAP